MISKQDLLSDRREVRVTNVSVVSTCVVSSLPDASLHLPVYVGQTIPGVT